MEKAGIFAESTEILLLFNTLPDFMGLASFDAWLKSWSDTKTTTFRRTMEPIPKTTIKASTQLVSLLKIDDSKWTIIIIFRLCISSVW